VTGTGAESAAIWQSLSTLGIQQETVCEQLEQDGVKKFIEAWEELRATVQTAMDQIT
jgi:transaldolase